MGAAEMEAEATVEVDEEEVPEPEEQEEPETVADAEVPVHTVAVEEIEDGSEEGDDDDDDDLEELEAEVCEQFEEAFVEQPKAVVKKAPAAKAPVAKAPVTKAPLTKAPVAKAAVIKAPVAKAPVSKAPLAKTSAVKPVGKGSQISPISTKGAKGKGSGKTLATNGGASSLQPKGKGRPADAGVGIKVSELNRARHWASGIDVPSLTLLRGLPQERALEILTSLESKAQAVKNPNAFIQVAAKRPANGKVGASNGQTVDGKGTKRPSEESVEESPAKKRSLPSSVAQKVEALTAQGISLGPLALKALNGAEARDAMIVLQVLAKREKVKDPSQFIIASLKKKAELQQESGDQATSVPQRPAATAPKPVVKSIVKPGAKLAGKDAVGKPVATGGSGIGKPPRPRTGLEFESVAMQAKLQAMNTMGLWPGPHPLDDAALTALLKITAARALEILEEAEEDASEISDPSSFVRKLVVDELKIQAAN